MLRNTLGIVNIEGNNVHFGDVMKHRGVQAFGFLGRYRLIDFALSNMSNSGITEFQVYMPAEMRSTIQHVGIGNTIISTANAVPFACSIAQQTQIVSIVTILMPSQKTSTTSKILQKIMC